MKALQQEMKELQKKMTDAAKNKRDNELNEAISQNWKITMEIMKIQMQMFVVLIGLLLLLSYTFPIVEPGTQDDVKLALYDDGLASHCDISSGDGIFSNCYAFPANATRGAWVADIYLYSAAGEQLARQGAPIYYEGGKPEDLWLQTASQSGLLEGLQGKVAYTINASTGKQNYAKGETAAISAHSLPAQQPGGKFEAALDSGTFFHVDLPFSIPLLNIRRIIGSYGFFIFSAFVLSIVYSIAKAAYAKIPKPAKPAQ